MALEVASFIGQLDKTWPVTGDQIAQGDDQIRLLKATLQKTFPGMTGEVMRVVGKAAGFTPSVDESTVIYNCTAAITVTLPALGGVVAGTYWFVNAGSGAVTITPNGTETVNGAASGSVASGTWALITRASSTNWVALGIPAMTAAAIVAALGTTPVAKATDANTLDGYDSTAFVRTVNSVAPTAGNVVVNVGVTSVNGNDGAVTAGQVAAAATAGYGYTPANGASYSPVWHTHPSTYAPISQRANVIGGIVGSLKNETQFLGVGSTYVGSGTSITMHDVGIAVSGTWVCLGVFGALNTTTACRALFQRIA